MLLVTASLVAVRGMVRMLHASLLGFEPQGAMLAEVDLSPVGPGGDVPLEKRKAMIEAVRNIPGVDGGGHGEPSALYRRCCVGFRSSRPGRPSSPSTIPCWRRTCSRYRRDTWRRPAPGCWRGRDFSWQDTTGTPQVAIVNQTFARKMWGDTPAIGQRFIVRRGQSTEVVGVVEDGKYHSMQESPQPAVYLSLSQNEASSVTLVVRSPRAMNEMAATLERTLSGLVPNAEISVRSWPDALGGMLFPARAATLSLGVMGLLAAMLAVTGIFGMAAYNVSRRMKELGIRVALGARTKHVMSAAVGRPIVLLGVGSLVGLLSGVFASRLLGQIVYQADPMDPVVLGGAVLTMALLGIAASAIPALRALAVDPSRLMREE